MKDKRGTREKHHVVFDLHMKKIAMTAVCAAKALSTVKCWQITNMSRRSGINSSSCVGIIYQTNAVSLCLGSVPQIVSSSLVIPSCDRVQTSVRCAPTFETALTACPPVPLEWMTDRRGWSSNTPTGRVTVSHVTTTAHRGEPGPRVFIPCVHSQMCNNQGIAEISRGCLCVADAQDQD